MPLRRPEVFNVKYSWLYFWVTVLKLTSCDKKETLLKERGRGWRGAGGGGGGVLVLESKPEI